VVPSVGKSHISRHLRLLATAWGEKVGLDLFETAVRPVTDLGRGARLHWAGEGSTGMKTLWLAMLLCALPVGAQTKIVRLPDGSLFLYNERPVLGLTAAVEAPPDLAEMIERRAQRHSLDPKLVRAVVQVESGFRPRALSRKGAIGLMQLMPETAKAMSVSDPWDPEQNLEGGSSYLRQLLDQFSGDLELALAGYNAGPGAVGRYGGIPPYKETIAYVQKVMTAYRSQGGEASHGWHRLATGRSTRLTRDATGRFVLSTAR